MLIGLWGETTGIDLRWNANIGEVMWGKHGTWNFGRQWFSE